jgi:hypothetical protein
MMADATNNEAPAVYHHLVARQRMASRRGSGLAQDDLTRCVLDNNLVLADAHANNGRL